jgi:maleamate amidohydrolase
MTGPRKLGLASSPSGEHRAGFGGDLGFGARPAVVVVDLVEGFTNPESPLGADLDAVVESTRRLLDGAREAGVPVLFTTVVYDEANERAAAVFLRKVPALGVLRPGSRWIEVDARLGRRADEPVLAKAFASAFFGTPLAAMLAGRDTLVICGATTSGCVRATVVDALQHGLVPIVPRECVGDRWQAAHDANLFDVDAKYGDVLALSDVLDAMHEAGQLTAEDA